MSTTTKLTDKGLDLITALLVASGIKYVGWGTGTTAAAHGDTALQTPAAPARATGTQSQQQTNVTKDTYRVAATLAATGTVAITELGLFDGAGAGSPPTGANLAMRRVFDALNLVSGNAIDWTIDIPIVSAYPQEQHVNLLEQFRLEPARIYGIVVAALAVAVAFGLHLTEGQQVTVLGLAAAIIGAFEHTRSMVSPKARTEERRDPTKPEEPPIPPTVQP